jgi:hypothetical protein
MNCQRAREIFPELLDRRTPATAHLDARTHLASCPDCQREFAALNQTAHALDAMSSPPPSPRLRKNFYAMLEEEKHSAASVRAATEREQRARRASLWRWVLSPLAACALIALGFALGKRSMPTPQASRAETWSETMALQTELKKLREDMQKMGAAVAYQIYQQQQGPANERLRDVLTAAKADKPSDKVLDDLILALTFDPNANVRLRAISALQPHAERDVVRAGVLAALPREQNPLVQLELIDFVAATQDPTATPVLEKIAADEAADTSVRDAAKFALAQL